MKTKKQIEKLEYEIYELTNENEDLKNQLEEKTNNSRDICYKMQEFQDKALSFMFGLAVILSVFAFL
jgi:prefoldin subunit 5